MKFVIYANESNRKILRLNLNCEWNQWNRLKCRYIPIPDLTYSFFRYVWFNTRVNRFFEIRWWNLIRFVCVFDLCVLFQCFIDSFVYSTIDGSRIFSRVCDFRYVRFICNESGVIIRRRRRREKIKFRALILTWLERWNE